MKKVLFIRSNPVDPDSRLEKEASTLIKHGFHVEVVGWDRGEKYKVRESVLSLEHGKAKIYRFGIPAIFGGGFKKNLLPLLNFQLKLYNWLSKRINNYDVIHACDFDTAFTAQIIAKKHKKKFIYDIFDYYVDSFNVPPKFKKLVESLDHKTINSSDATIICSEKRVEQIKGTNPKQLSIIHNTPNNIIGGKKNLDLNTIKIKIVYVGILSEGRFIKEIADFVIRNSSYEFHIGGFGKLHDYFEKMSKEHGNIFYYGKLSYERTLILENSCDIITAIYNPNVANHFYAAPNKFYEALMLGKPVIMVKNTGMDEVVFKHNIGEIIDYEISSFESGISRLVNRIDEWPEIGNRMKTLYKQEYSWSEMERRLINVYKKL